MLCVNQGIIITETLKCCSFYEADGKKDYIYLGLCFKACHHFFQFFFFFFLLFFQSLLLWFQVCYGLFTLFRNLFQFVNLDEKEKEKMFSVSWQWLHVKMEKGFRKTHRNKHWLSAECSDTDTHATMKVMENEAPTFLNTGWFKPRNRCRTHFQASPHPTGKNTTRNANLKTYLFYSLSGCPNTKLQCW